MRAPLAPLEVEPALLGEELPPLLLELHPVGVEGALVLDDLRLHRQRVAHARRRLLARLGVRGLPDDALAEGGCLWFPDLSVPDAYLPALCVTAAYANLERQLAAPPGKASIAGAAKNIGQLALIATAPVTFALPSGFHLFWLSSTAFTAGSGEAFRVLDRPPVMPPPPVAASSKEASPPRRPRRRRKGKKRRS